MSDQSATETASDGVFDAASDCVFDAASDGVFDAASDGVFDALGDRTRRRMLELLRGGAMPVGALADKLPVGRPAVSKHLRVLESAGLVEHRSQGTRNLYALAPEGLVGLQHWLVTVWDTALSSFADYVETDGRADKGER
jgi:DNA-binding transcriptional ArsR family regulator